jgi:hypothetical protein
VVNRGPERGGHKQLGEDFHFRDVTSLFADPLDRRPSFGGLLLQLLYSFRHESDNLKTSKTSSCGTSYFSNRC